MIPPLSWNTTAHDHCNNPSPLPIAETSQAHYKPVSHEGCMSRWIHISWVAAWHSELNHLWIRQHALSPGVVNPEEEIIVLKLRTKMKYRRQLIEQKNMTIFRSIINSCSYISSMRWVHSLHNSHKDSDVINLEFQKYIWKTNLSSLF